MEHIKHKIKTRLHTLKNKIKTNQNIQIGLYASAILIVLILSSMILITTLNKEEKFLSYNVKACYNKKETQENSPSNILYTTNKDKLIIEYTFNQKCYSKNDMAYDIKDNQISVYFITLNLKESCFCDTKVTAELGPLTKTIYNLKFYKKTDKETYLIKEENIAIR